MGRGRIRICFDGGRHYHHGGMEMTGNFCRNCGRPTGDRHLVCWKCKRGLSRRVLVEEFKTEPSNYACACTNPRPEFIRMFGGYQCGKCGYPIRGVESEPGPSSATGSEST